MSHETMFGIRIVSHPLLDGFRVPVLKIRDDVPCSEPTRSQVNRYLLETFGEHEIAILTQDAMFLSPKHTAILRMQRDSLLSRRVVGP